ncbi:YlbF family regulator [Vagococcus acidifermentans]|uniref:Cell fate regulator YmcA, YheA/YmcA/DUF963 family (Controls sporulation, competence, biofilm development) n=1 Tax=Vagococcus acidifermentans TaxID=564710 RepID=A0A430B2J3_9ENTE|nr:YlbF family regulator [Vagococcus acidifermentans]RSU14557.1 hypothetical protein CBF27_00800 [Vagococcus acidifermentans]
MDRDYKYEPKVAEKLELVIRQLTENEVIQEYQKLEQQIGSHQGLKELVEAIKRHQKDAVQFAHYGKPNAEQEALRQADELTSQFDNHPLVMAYRDSLIEANDLLQHVTKLLEQRVNQGLADQSTIIEDKE